MELYDLCTLKNATVKGVRGVLFTSDITGNTLFIPGNGHFSGTTYNVTNSYRLWSSTLSSGKEAYGWYTTYTDPNKDNMQYKGERCAVWLRHLGRSWIGGDCTRNKAHQSQCK